MGQAIATSVVDDLAPGVQQPALVLHRCQGLPVPRQHHPAAEATDAAQRPRCVLGLPFVSRLAAVYPDQGSVRLAPSQEVVSPEAQKAGVSPDHQWFPGGFHQRPSQVRLVGRMPGPGLPHRDDQPLAQPGPVFDRWVGAIPVWLDDPAPRAQGMGQPHFGQHRRAGADLALDRQPSADGHHALLHVRQPQASARPAGVEPRAVIAQRERRVLGNAVQVHVDPGGPGVSGHVVQRLLGHAVQRLGRRGRQQRVAALHVQVDQDVLPRAEEQCVVVERHRQPLLLERPGSQVLDQAGHLPLGGLGRRLDLANHFGQVGRHVLRPAVRRGL